MIVDLSRGSGFPIVLYDSETDTLSTQTRPEFGGRPPEYWRPHPRHRGLLVGYVRDEHEVRDEYDDPPRLEPFDCPETLKLLRASLEPRWSVARSCELHASNFLVYDGFPGMGLVHEMMNAMELLDGWLDSRQLEFDFGEMAER